MQGFVGPGVESDVNMGPAPSFVRKQKSPPLSDSLNVVRIPNERGGATAANVGLSKNTKKRARQAANTAKGSSAAAIAAPPVVLAISDADRCKGGRKGAGSKAVGVRRITLRFRFD